MYKILISRAIMVCITHSEGAPATPRNTSRTGATSRVTKQLKADPKLIATIIDDHVTLKGSPDQSVSLTVDTARADQSVDEETSRVRVRFPSAKFMELSPILWCIPY